MILGKIKTNKIHEHSKMAENEKPNHGKSRKRKAAKEKEANVPTTWTYDEKQKFVSGISIFQ